MKIIKDNRKHGEVIIGVSFLDDLWFLSQVIEKNDKVTAKTIRKIKVGGQDERKSSVIKKWIRLTIEVEKVEFHKYSSNLRIAGKIIEGPEDIPRGSFHTIAVEEGTVLGIEKKEWLKHQWQQLQEAAREKPPKILICVLDRKEVTFALLKRYGYEILTEWEGEVEEKRFSTGKKDSKFYAEVIEKIVDYEKRFAVESILLASPAFWKDDLMKELERKHPDLKKKITLATCYSSGKSGISELLRREEIKKVLKQERIMREISIVEELEKEIATDGAAAYGLNEVEEVVQMGAVKILLITDELVQEYRQKEKYAELEQIMKTVEITGGEIHIITTEHETGQKLQGLGGIAALLRYKKYD